MCGLNGRWSSTHHYTCGGKGQKDQCLIYVFFYLFSYLSIKNHTTFAQGAIVWEMIDINSQKFKVHIYYG